MFKTLLNKFKDSIKIPERTGRSGLTMIELMVVLAVTVIISVSSFAAFGIISSPKAIKNALDETEALLTAARRKSITQENGMRWGVRVENTSSTKRFSMFSGLSYASGTPSNFFSPQRNVVITNPIASTTYDVLFEPITGFLSEKKVLTLATLKKDGIIGDLVLGAVGSVTKRYDYGLVGYWHLDEGVGTSTVDATGIGNDGTLTNGPTWQASTNCKAGTCLSFDGTDDFISVVNSPSLNSGNAVSIVFWIKDTGSTGNYSGIVNKKTSSAGYLIQRLMTTSQIYMRIDTSAGLNQTFGFMTVLDGNWHQVAYVIQDNQRFAYTDGLLVASGTYNFGDGFVNNANLNLVGGGISAKLDEIRIYNRALSASEVLAIYNDLK